MPTNTIDLINSNYFKYLSKNRIHQEWTLCLGAGICKGILPDWIELTYRIVIRCFNFNWSLDEFKQHTRDVGFSLDSWIQGSLNKHILSDNANNILTFNQILEEELYKDLLENANKYKIRDDVIMSFEHPKKLNLKQLRNVCDFFEKEYGNTTLMVLVNLLLEPISSISRPNQIVTFNADTLLYSLLVIFNIRKNDIGTNDLKFPKEPYRKITKPYETWGDNIPIFQIHGSISPKSITRKTINDSRDDLVFLESSYTILKLREVCLVGPNQIFYTLHKITNLYF